MSNDTYEPLQTALEGLFTKPFRLLPENLKSRVQKAFQVTSWDSVTPDWRRHRSIEWDMNNDPARTATNEHCFGLVSELDDVRRKIVDLELAAAPTVDQILKRDSSIKELRERESQLLQQIDAPRVAPGEPLAADPQAVKPIINSDADIKRSKKSALIRKYEREWPTAERDINEGSRNGLTEAALGNGFYDEEKAIKWAKERGKFKDSIVASTSTKSIADAPTSVMNRIK